MICNLKGLRSLTKDQATKILQVLKSTIYNKVKGYEF